MYTITGTTSGKTDTATLTVTAGPLASITISPKTATINAGGTQTYTAKGFDSYGNSRGNVTGSTNFSASGGATCSANVCGSNSAGTYTITGTNSGKTDTATLTVKAPLPVISGFSPTAGVVGTAVTITGSNLNGTKNVKFNGTPASFNVVSNTKITTTVPDGALTGKISVTTAAGNAVSSAVFKVRPAITSFTPTSAKVGRIVTITGSAFTGATKVKFNGVSATFNVVSYTQITTSVPNGATTGKISVTTPGGTATSSVVFTVKS